jgi:2-aminoadipate transaminase
MATRLKPSALSALGQRTTEPPISWLMKLTLDQPDLISLAVGFTDNASLPRAEIRDLLNDLLRSPSAGQAALQYGSTAGDPVLRQLTADHLRSADGISAASAAAKTYSPERLVITNGSQQLLYLVTEALCDPGDIVLLEDPTYFVYLGIAQSHGLRSRAIRLLADGINVEQLEHTLESLRRSGELPRVKLLYLVTYYQNPTGITTTLEKKARALELLRRYEKLAGHPIYLLEDAAYRELRFAGEPVRSALVAGDPARVIYTGTYSKPFATGARIGFGLLPPELRAAVVRIKGNHDFGSANLLQQLLARALASGRYQTHVTELARRYARKAATMTAALREHFPATIRWQEPQGGLYVWAQLPSRSNAGVQSQFFARALAQGVLYVPGELCYADDPTRARPRHELRLSFGGASPADIRAGIARLGAVVQTFSRSLAARARG